MCKEILSDVGRSHRLGISDVVDEVWINNIGTVMDKNIGCIGICDGQVEIKKQGGSVRDPGDTSRFGKC